MSEYKLGVTTSGRLAVKGQAETLLNILRVPGAQMHYGDGGQWLSMPATRVAIMCVEAMGAPTSVSEEYMALRSSLMSSYPEAVQEWNKHKPLMKRPLLQHQEDFCALAFGLRGIINGSEQGTGKTIMSAALIGAWRAKEGISKVLIVAPKSPLRQWEAELYDSLPDDRCPLFIPLDDQPVVMRRAMLVELGHADEFVAVAVNYEVLHDMVDAIIRFAPDVVIFDESWKVKTPTAKVTKAAIKITESLGQNAHVMCLNGTLYSNNVGDAWSQLAVVTSKANAGKYPDWMRDYANAVQMNVGGRAGIITKYTGVKDPVGLMSRLSPVYWRATKASCLDLPEKLVPVRVHLEMSRAQTDLYELVKESGEAGLSPVMDINMEWTNQEDVDGADGELTPDQAQNLSLAGAITTSLRLQQITSGFLPDTLTYQIPLTSVPHVHAEHNESTKHWWFDTPKKDWMRQWLRDTLAGDPNVRAIVWCKFNHDVMNVGEIAESILGPDAVRRIMGGKHGTTDKQLDDVKESFNSRDHEGVRLLVAQVKRLAYGHNLQACDFNILYSHSWSYLERDQLEDRSHRYGRIGPVAYIELVCTKPSGAHTIDREVLLATEAKETMAERLARDTTTMLRRM